MYENFPLELRERRQWVCWRYENVPGKDKPTKPLYRVDCPFKASHSDPTTWGTFEQAVTAVASFAYNGIGYVCSKEDPYSFIDLDTYDSKLTDEDRKFHSDIASAFTGYAELSPSGKGLHIIIRGKVPTGRKRRGVEIYSDSRFMTVTGNVWRAGPIIEQSGLAYQLWHDLGGKDDAEQHFPDQQQAEDDSTICERAANASNGELFMALWNGQWQQQYPSQSEADFALVDILAFYTQNRQQITRIFRSSALGKREKAQRDAYVNYMLAKAFDNQPPPIDIDKMKAQLLEAISKQNAARAAEAPKQAPAAVIAAPQHEQPPAVSVAASAAAVGDEPPASEVYRVPPGLLGEIARYIYSTSPRPVAEISIAGAIALMAGICGRSYNVNGTGLNQYIMLLAPTGSGKEAIASGIAQLMTCVQRVGMTPAAMDFIGPGEIRSDVALLKYISKKSPSFVTIAGEFGQTLAAMARPNAASHLLGIKRVMLDLYAKSGAGSILRPTIYSDADKNTLALQAPAFSFLGESAPEPFYENVNEALIADGLLPRFTLIEYTGPRPALNPNANHEPIQPLVTSVAQLCVQSLMLNNASKALPVDYTPEAKRMLDRFELQCTAAINRKDTREVTRHIWNRAHLRALKLASLVAVGVNPYLPTIDEDAAKWAIQISSYNTQKLLERFERGDIGGVTDDHQVREVVRVVRDYVSEPWAYIQKYTSSEALYNAAIVPYSYINKRLAATSGFRTDRRGATVAIKIALQTMVDSGDLSEVPKQTIFTRYGLTLKAYAIVNAATFTK